MFAPTCSGDAQAACQQLDRALRAALCITSIHMSVRHSGHRLEYRSSSEETPRHIKAGGAIVRMLIRDERGIVGEIEIVDGCHPTCTGAAIHEMARIAEAYAPFLRQALAATETPRAVAV